MIYNITYVKTLDELRATQEFYRTIFQGKCDIDNPVYSLEAWQERMASHNNYMLYASEAGQVVGMAFGRLNGDESMIIGPLAVHPQHRNKGIASDLLGQLEGVAKKNGVLEMVLGALKSANEFYLGQGYKGALLIQSEEHSLKQLNSLVGSYEVMFSKVYDDRVNQLCLEVDNSNDALEDLYQETFPGCYTMMMYKKRI